MFSRAQELHFPRRRTPDPGVASPPLVSSLKHPDLFHSGSPTPGLAHLQSWSSAPFFTLPLNQSSLLLPFARPPALIDSDHAPESHLQRTFPALGAPLVTVLRRRLPAPLDRPLYASLDNLRSTFERSESLVRNSPKRFQSEEETAEPRRHPIVLFPFPPLSMQFRQRLRTLVLSAFAPD